MKESCLDKVKEEKKLDRLWKKTMMEQFKFTLNEIKNIEKLRFLYNHYQCEGIRKLIKERMEKLGFKN